MRRFILGWKALGHESRLDAHIVNYADDFVICCKRGNAQAAMARMKTLMTRLGLTVNEAKTRIACLPEESFNFLGYTFGRFYNREGQPYIGTRPSRKAIKSLLARIHERTSSQRYADTPAEVVSDINRQLRGWSGYFDQGPVMKVYGLIRQYTERRVRRWLVKRRGGRGTGYRQFSDDYLYQNLKLYALPLRRADLPRAKV